MIVARIFGGLGNQFFQYAAARRLAHVHQTELLLETSWFRGSLSRTTPRAYELSRYPIKARLVTHEDIRWPGFYTGRIAGRMPLPRALRLCREAHFHFDPEVLRSPDRTFLDGYWQSPRYFGEIEVAIRAELTPLAPMAEGDQRIAEMIGGTNSVAIHVRRGDYSARRSTAGLHGICPIDYYHAAVKSILAELKSPLFLVFSDDPEWTRANLVIPAPTVHVRHNSAPTAFQDLRLMSLCHHQIIANSSFSWWGAWLNQNPAKIVIAPRAWFRTNIDTADLIPAGWRRL